MTENAKKSSILQRHARIARAPYRDTLSFFDFQHLPEVLQNVSKPFHRMAHSLVDGLPNHPQKLVALQKLLEAKDAAVRIAVASTHDQRDRIKLLIAEGHDKGNSVEVIFSDINKRFPKTKITEKTVLEYINILQQEPEE